MNQEGLEKKQKRIIFYALFISLFCIIGVTYAFFTAGMSSETSTTVRADAGTMKITYDGGANINLSGIYPRDEVWATKNITVTGNNTTDAQMLYKLTLVVDSNTFKTYDPLQYELVSTNTSANGEVIPAISKKDIPSSSIELGSGHFIKANNAKHTYQLKIYYPKKTTSQNDNQGASFSAHVEITSIKPPKTTGTLSELILYNNEVKTPLTEPGKEISAHTLDDVESTTESVDSKKQKYYITYGTGWEANGDKFNLTGTAVTSDTYVNSYSSLVGKYLVGSSTVAAGSSTAGSMRTTTNLSSVYYVVSATQESFTYKTITSNKNITEALLASTEDDYGTSYYFRGAVKNNYVEFANKCWRIVRINGDGSVKLVLHNDNTSNAANPCSSANNSEDAAFATNSVTTYTSAFNEDYDDNAYIGFMYGQAGASDYASTHANTHKSTILRLLETWYYVYNLASYESKLADTIWCNDKSIVTDATYNPWSYGGTPNGLGYGTNKTFYNATKRLDSASGTAGGTGPSLKCPNDNNGGKLSKFTVADTINGNGNLTYKIGLLTADELAYAGYTSGSDNPATYLQENATSTYWGSLSPYGFLGKDTFVWYVRGGSGGLGRLEGIYAGYAGGLRPAISLISSTYANGVGSSENPYKVV